MYMYVQYLCRQISKKHQIRLDTPWLDPNKTLAEQVHIYVYYHMYMCKDTLCCPYCNSVYNVNIVIRISVCKCYRRYSMHTKNLVNNPKPYTKAHGI